MSSGSCRYWSEVQVLLMDALGSCVWRDVVRTGWRVSKNVHGIGGPVFPLTSSPGGDVSGWAFL